MQAVSEREASWRLHQNRGTSLFQEGLYEFLDHCRAATDLPLALGFGLRRGADLAALHGKVEVGIVGSALLSAWEEGGESGYAALVEELAAARGLRAVCPAVGLRHHSFSAPAPVPGIHCSRRPRDSCR